MKASLGIDFYESTGNILADRILKLIPEHPEILTIEGAFDMFKVEGFYCDDLQPSLGQATWAIGRACRMYKESLQKDKNEIT